MDAWTPTLALERFELLRRVWSLGDDAGERAPQLRLRPDGRLACLEEEGLEAWDVRGASLLLLDRAGVAIARFDAPATEDGRTVFAGHVLDAPAHALTLRETDPVEAWPEPASRRALQPCREFSPRRHLVVTTGEAFAGWAPDIAADDRSWDLCLLGHADEDAELDPEWSLEVDAVAEGRWGVLHTLLFPGAAPFRYDHVAFADAHVQWSWLGANEAFAAARAHDLLIGHPAIAASPGAGDAASSERFEPAPGRLLGFGTPAALDCPIFSAEALRVCAPSFALDPEGSPELAMLWAALLGAPLTRLAVIDAIAPVALAGRARRSRAPESGLLARYGLTPRTLDAGLLRTE